MEQIGKVLKLNDDFAIVQIKRATACGSDCGSCSGCAQLDKTVLVKNSIGAHVQDIVKFELDTNKVLFAAFIVYIIPIIIFIVGYIALNIWYGIVFFAIPFIVLKILDKKISKKYVGNITNIIDHKNQK